MACVYPPVRAGAQARDTSSRAASARRDAPRHRSSRDYSVSTESPYATHVATPRIDAFGSPRAVGLVTRADRIRAEALRRDLPVGLVDPAPRWRSPVARSLTSRNLLQSRSILGMTLTSMAGRLDPAMDPEHTSTASAYQPGLHFNPVPPWGGRSYNEVLAEEQKKRADSYFDLAVASFRASDLFRAQQYLGLARQLRPDDPKTDCAEVLVAFQARNFNSALARFDRALDPDRSQSLEDLRLDTGAFFPNEQDFRRLVRRLNLSANAPDAGPEVKLLLAYFSWLSDDQGTARLSAEAAHAGFQARRQPSAIAAEGIEPPGTARSAERFRNLLLGSPAPPVEKAP